jgi:very-short-patch-repair endonuclease
MRKIREAPRGDERVAAFARAQAGVVSLAQLTDECGLKPSAISRRVARGRLHRWAPRVFAVGHTVLTQRGRCIGALLFGGEDGLLTHVDAAELLGIVPATDRARTHVTVPTHRRSTARLDVHWSVVEDFERTVRRGLPVTTAARTILDLADTSSQRLVEQALDQAQIRRLLTADDLERTLAHANGRRGVRTLRAAYRAHLEGLTVTRSELEEAFLAFLRARGFPRPRVNELVLGHRVDFFWPDRRLIVETDGLRVHTLPGAFERDRRRDRVHRSAGLRVERITWGDVTRRADDLEAELRGWLPEC